MSSDNVDQRGAPGGFASVNLRRADPNYTIVLIDGVRINDPTDMRGGGKKAADRPKCTLSGALVTLSIVFAQNQAVAEEILPTPITVLGSRIPQSVVETPANVTILTRTEIRDANAGSVPELLKAVPGIFVQESQGRSGIASIFIRGAEPNYTQVLIDGIRANDELNSRGGSFDFSLLDIANIERIEIYRGPSSAIYGSDAIAGVVNIITRSGSRVPAAELRIESDTSRSSSVSAWGGREVHGAIIGIYASADTRQALEAAGSNTYSVGTAAHYDVSDAFRIGSRISWTRNDARSFPDDSGGPQFSILRTLDHRSSSQLLVGIYAEQDFGTKRSQSLFYGFAGREGDDISPGVWPSISQPSGIPSSVDHASFGRHELTWTTRFSPVDRFSAAAGADGQVEQGSDSGRLNFSTFQIPTSYELSRRTLALFAEARFLLMDHSWLSASAREDWTTHYKPVVTNGVELSYAQSKMGAEFVVRWGNGFHLPSFYALANPIVGDRKLKAERSESTDVTWKQSISSAVEFSLTAFDTRYTNLIDFDAGPPPRLVNRDVVKVSGIEAALHLQFDHNISFSPQTTYCSTIEKTTGQQLHNRPRWIVGGTLFWTSSRAVSMRVQSLYVGAVLDESIPISQAALSPYERVDVSLAWNMRANLKMRIALENILNRRYEESIGNPSPGLLGRVAIEATFF